jgi:hypothetical protein
VQRTPVSAVEQQRVWRAKAQVEALFPESVESMRELKERKHREAHARFDIEWGTEQQYSIRGRIQAEQNKEQKKWLARADKEIARRDVPAFIAFERLRDAAQLNQLKMVIQHRASPVVHAYAALGFELLKANNWWSTRYAQPIQPIEQDKITVRLTVDPATRRYLNVTVETPQQVARINDILMPIRITALHIRRNQPIRNTNNFLERVMPQQNAECTVNTRKVQTFDEVIYKAPITTCWSVLAQDCSSESTTPRFTVLLKKQSKTAEEKTLRVITPKHDEIPLLILSLYLSNDGGAAGAGLAPTTAGGFALPVWGRGRMTGQGSTVTIRGCRARTVFSDKPRGGYPSLPW